MVGVLHCVFLCTLKFIWVTCEQKKNIFVQLQTERDRPSICKQWCCFRTKHTKRTGPVSACGVGWPVGDGRRRQQDIKEGESEIAFRALFLKNPGPSPSVQMGGSEPPSPMAGGGGGWSDPPSPPPKNRRSLNTLDVREKPC